MKFKTPRNYLRSYRLRWSLSQSELASLLGWERSEIISRIEKKKRYPTLRLVMACFILFGTPAAELFPDIAASVETDVMGRIWEFYQKIQGDSSKKTRVKIELLEDAIERAKQRDRKPLHDT
jgi:transcriptional regulator with XRE-family HTH domain